MSTNEVFDGLKGEPYVESDAPNPINAYGRSKLEGEEQARALVEQAATSCGRPGCTAAAARLPVEDTGGRVAAAGADGGDGRDRDADAWRATWRRRLRASSSSDVYGVYHFTNSGECSRFEWAREVLRLAGRADVVLKPTTLAEYNPYPPKPPYTVLRNEAGAQLGITLRPWQEALAEHFASPRATP